MMALLQRVLSASVRVGAETTGAIGPGLAVFVGVERGDGEAAVDRLLDRVLGYRVFEDAQGRMNLSLRDAGGELLLVPQFTLPADTHKGMRPSFTPAAPPEQGRALYEHMLEHARSVFSRVQSGRFGAHMRVELVNDGPATFLLRTARQ